MTNLFNTHKFLIENKLKTILLNDIERLTLRSDEEGK